MVVISAIHEVGLGNRNQTKHVAVPGKTPCLADKICEALVMKSLVHLGDPKDSTVYNSNKREGEPGFAFPEGHKREK